MVNLVTFIEGGSQEGDASGDLRGSHAEGVDLTEAILEVLEAVVRRRNEIRGSVHQKEGVYGMHTSLESANASYLVEQWTYRTAWLEAAMAAKATALQKMTRIVFGEWGVVSVIETKRF